jgi:hypothetical protein
LHSEISKNIPKGKILTPFCQPGLYLSDHRCQSTYSASILHCNLE